MVTKMVTKQLFQLSRQLFQNVSQQVFRQISRQLVLSLFLIVTLCVQGCAAVGVNGLQSFSDSLDGYRFLYPTGWVEVKVSNADIVFHDIIEQTENVSVVINPVAGQKKLQDLGSPTDVGYQIGKNALAPEGSGRTAELVNAQETQLGDKAYYLLEYLVKLPSGQQRHNLASAVVSRGKLFTFNASTPEDRWETMQPLLEKSVRSFNVN